MLLAVTYPPTPAEAADPWKWWTFHWSVWPRLGTAAPELAAAAVGLAAAWWFRRRDPAVARRVALGCGVFAAAFVWSALGLWMEAVLDPDPADPAFPARRPARDWASIGGHVGARTAAAWLLVSAVLLGRSRRPEGGET